MKGIVLAGGSGTRLNPITLGISKQMLPIYDKPLIYYPISVLMLAGIREILIISTPEDMPNFKRLLGTGEQVGVAYSYAVQASPDGLAQAFIIGKEFIGNDSVCLVLGDNIFYGQGFTYKLKEIANKTAGATIFGYQVKDPERFGVVAFDENKQVRSIEEKPDKPKSKFGILPLYYFKSDIFSSLNKIKPGKGKEFQLTDAIQNMIKEKQKVLAITLNKNEDEVDVGTVESYRNAQEITFRKA